MREFERKRRFKRRLFSPIVLVALFLIFIFLIRGTWSIYWKDRDASALLHASEERQAKLLGRQEKLLAAIAKLNTESGIESEIRDRFQLGREGEREIVIVDDPNAKKSLPPQSKNFLQKIIDFFTIR